MAALKYNWTCTARSIAALSSGLPFGPEGGAATAPIFISAPSTASMAAKTSLKPRSWSALGAPPPPRAAPPPEASSPEALGNCNCRAWSKVRLAPMMFPRANITATNRCHKSKSRPAGPTAINAARYIVSARSRQDRPSDATAAAKRASAAASPRFLAKAKAAAERKGGSAGTVFRCADGSSQTSAGTSSESEEASVRSSTGGGSPVCTHQRSKSLPHQL
mmetsp:Transcript_12860/g.26055  ORF Transcript_12860/g.26055 Transcript_12860/m.26055 type:complete len:220 (+) Transcript_12860:121-780(+)